MSLPTFITHYYEKEHGPFLNICDLSDDALADLFAREKTAKTAFNRFTMGEQFIHFRRAADDLLIESYHKKFGMQPAGRPYYSVLGTFDKTLTMFRDGKKLCLPLACLAPEQVTFMYPDHAHLISYHGSSAPPLFYKLPKNWRNQAFWGQLFTYEELATAYEPMGIGEMIRSWQSQDGWAGCYVEAHLWDRSLRDTVSKQNTSPPANE